MLTLLKKPSAWIPVALSLATLAMLLSFFAVSGIPTPEENADEGVAARLFQIWLVLEVVLVAFFAVKWLPRAPRQALLILAIQISVAIAACFPVFYFNL